MGPSTVGREVMDFVGITNMEWADTPLVTRKRFNNLSTLYEQLKLRRSVDEEIYKFGEENRRRAVEELIEAKQTIQDLRMNLVEANAKLLEIKLGGML
jgi:hypothetical protein